jgi:stage II sporulation protein D
VIFAFLGDNFEFLIGCSCIFKQEHMEGKQMNSKRGILLLCLIFFLSMTLIPLAGLGGSSGAASGESSGSKNNDSSPGSSVSLPPSTKQFRIRDTSTGEVMTVDDNAFVRGAIAAEMSPEAPLEALKAQAVAAYTYYSRIRQIRREQSGNSYDFDACPSQWNVYVTDSEMQKRWGDSYKKYSDSLNAAAGAVLGQVLKYNGSLIDATYFAISPGNTENSADVWGTQYPYLISVASPWDAFAGGYQSSASFSESEFSERIKKVCPSANLTGDAGSWVTSPVSSAAGTVKTVQIGGQSLTGSQVREAFGLRSAAFTITHNAGQFTFTVKGYGHGVGMSQTGAEGMAREGATYREILSWYYPGTEIQTL